jgi:hypothetical protein
VSQDEIRVEVVYALPLEQDITQLTVCRGTTVGEAVKRSGVVDRHPEIALGRAGWRSTGAWFRSIRFTTRTGWKFCSALRRVGARRRRATLVAHDDIIPA